MTAAIYIGGIPVTGGSDGVTVGRMTKVGNFGAVRGGVGEGVGIGDGTGTAVSVGPGPGVSVSVGLETGTSVGRGVGGGVTVGRPATSPAKLTVVSDIQQFREPPGSWIHHQRPAASRPSAVAS